MTSAPVSGKFCRECGARLGPDAIFCADCGAATAEYRTVTKVSPAAKSGGMSTYQILIITAAIFILVSMIMTPMFRLYYDDSDPDDYYVVHMLSGNGNLNGETEDKVNETCITMFVLINGCAVATVLFSIAKKYAPAIGMSSLIAFLLFMYYTSVSSAWQEYARDMSNKAKFSVGTDSGFVFCVLAAILAASMAIAGYRTEKNK